MPAAIFPGSYTPGFTVTALPFGPENNSAILGGVCWVGKRPLLNERSWWTMSMEFSNLATARFPGTFYVASQLPRPHRQLR